MEILDAIETEEDDMLVKKEARCDDAALPSEAHAMIDWDVEKVLLPPYDVGCVCSICHICTICNLLRCCSLFPYFWPVAHHFLRCDWLYSLLPFIPSPLGWVIKAIGFVNRMLVKRNVPFSEIRTAAAAAARRRHVSNERRLWKKWNNQPCHWGH